jgi:hypothetical protein
MDDLIAVGAAVIIFMFIAAVLILYGAFVFLLIIAKAAISGEYGFLSGILAAAVFIIAGYAATGLWLHRTDGI